MNSAVDKMSFRQKAERAEVCEYVMLRWQSGAYKESDLIEKVKKYKLSGKTLDEKLTNYAIALYLSGFRRNYDPKRGKYILVLLKDNDLTKERKSSPKRRSISPRRESEEDEKNWSEHPMSPLRSDRTSPVNETKTEPRGRKILGSSKR